MAEIINFKRAKKRLNRSEREKRAETNRARSGRTKVEKLKTEAEQNKADRSLDGHRLDE